MTDTIYTIRNEEYPTEKLQKYYTTRHYTEEDLEHNIQYEYLEISWNINNVLLTIAMDIEFNNEFDNGVKRNCMWIEEIKKHMNWKFGDLIDIEPYTFNDDNGTFSIMLTKIDDEDPSHSYIYINEDGILMIRDKEIDWGFEEYDCFYNDKIKYELELEENGGYIMK